MKGWKIQRWLLCILMLFAPLAFAGVGRISGTVTDENGKPVAHLTVEASPIGMAWGGGIPQAKTDENGRFSIKVLAGRWAVYPRQDRDGYYPDLSSAFYTTAGSVAEQVEVSEENPEAVVNIRLGPKAAALLGHVTDLFTGATLHPQFELAWASGEPNKRMGIRMAADPYRILIPSNTDIKMTVQCEGHKPWAYPGVINLRPGQDMKLDIRLEPVPASPFSRP